MKNGTVTSLCILSEKGGLLRIRHPMTGEIVERMTRPGEKVVLVNNE